MFQRNRSRRFGYSVAGLCALGVLVAAIIDLTLEDFYLSGTQIGDVSTNFIYSSENCSGCHSPMEPGRFGPPSADPHSHWEGSLKAQSGRDPLFFAQMTNANQDVANAGYFCMRCHIPFSFVSGHAYDVDGSTLDEFDQDGVSCHFCHSMVDPIYKPGESPIEDVAILAALDDVPEYYGNAMFVLDPAGTVRGPREDAEPMHDFLQSEFHHTGEFCGTCHDVGNVAVSRNMDGTYRYNAIDQRTPSEDLSSQFPLQRTYTEWKLSAFANGGVDMGGRYGGFGDPLIETCQDCHMPKQPGYASIFGPPRMDIATHDFAGASSWVLEIIGLYYENDWRVNQQAIRKGMAAAKSMLKRAASIELQTNGDHLLVRVINETGHKLPTGHATGRRVFVGVQFFDTQGALVREYGQYDYDQAQLDEASTRVYEMHVGLSDYASDVTGLPAGVTTHMMLADTIEKDNRIPPRGFKNRAYEAGGAPVVGASYADGQYWDDIEYAMPTGAASARVTIYYQTVTRNYIEALRDGNHTDHWGDTIHSLWQQTDKAPPIEMISKTIQIGGG